ncbi:OLC1v1015127C1 [Oldenlandia corymbosa var. corymbosa]|uniref:RING-type E3 ubiquitin transferase n=1 Tax=Oldenlandia corymbosa var. corymbosa TaxID=529605 RepID=A0AAV1E3A1_OLDCO|nr:OLC1v1015127C1 [Oldenlandia corymbosa var. corymbosa]
MSVHDQAAAAVLSQLALAGDGAVLGLGLAYVAVRCILKFNADSAALTKIKQAPSVRVSDLRSLSSSGDDYSTTPIDQHDDGGKLVVVRGSVEPKSALEGGGNWKSLVSAGGHGVLISQESGEKGVILQRTHTCIYNEWRGFFGWTSDLRTLFARSWKEQESSTMRTVPFILVDPERWPEPSHVVVDMEGSRHPLPLTTVYHNLRPVTATPYTFLQALFGHQYPVGLLEEEKLLPVGKEVTAIGIYNMKHETPVIKSCKDLPFFLSDLTKDQMVLDLDFKTRVLFWSGIVVGSLAVGILGYAVVRNWKRWKEWRQHRERQEQNSTSGDDPNDEEPDEDNGDVPDGELCVVCLMRRRRSAFIPCGHLVCCRRCAFTVERDLLPKCPVCRQSIRGSVRIYDS